MKITQPPDLEAFDKLLTWLDPDREKAGEKYQKLHLRLSRIFAAKGCCQAEDLADETVNVVARKIDWLIENYVGDPALYFFGVAKKIYQPPRPLPNPPPPPDKTEIERRCSCLDKCLNLVTSSDEREVLLRYHQKEKGEKIRERKQIAKELGISINALRIRIWHVHARLRPCVQECVQQLEAGNALVGQDI
jgi:DNA-directed RNA polymerase specialized sigma24 family protein